MYRKDVTTNDVVIDLGYLPEKRSKIFKIENERSARGGSLEVYKAYADGQVYALKRVLPFHLNDKRKRKWFTREFQICLGTTGKEKHIPKYVGYQTNDLGELEGLVVQWIEGFSVVDYFEHRQKNRATFLDIARQCRDALEEVYAIKLPNEAKPLEYYGDISPKNFKIDEKGTVYIVDFSNAGVVQTIKEEDDDDEDADYDDDNHNALTWSYMAPEQVDAKPKPLTVASDTFRLGLLIYKLLTGKHPFVDKEMGVFGLISGIANEGRGPNPLVLEDIIPYLPNENEATQNRVLDKLNKCFQTVFIKNPAVNRQDPQKQRYQTPREFIAALEEAFSLN